jgi:mono/diheme cytochrome c family protein
MNTSKQPKSGGSRDSFLIFVFVCCGILATLSFNMFKEPVPPQGEQSDRLKAEETKSGSPKKKNRPVALTDIPLATGHEPMEKLFVQSGCAVCHTIPGIDPAKGREGPILVLGTNGPLRLADPNYQGTAESVREYIQESILNPGAYIVPGYSDRVMPRWYGKRLNAKSLDRIATYLAGLQIK